MIRQIYLNPELVRMFPLHYVHLSSRHQVKHGFKHLLKLLRLWKLTHKEKWKVQIVSRNPPMIKILPEKKLWNIILSYPNVECRTVSYPLYSERMLHESGNYHKIYCVPVLGRFHWLPLLLHPTATLHLRLESQTM